MLEISVAEAIERLATGVQLAKASDLSDIESRLFREYPSPIPPAARDIAYHIRSGLQSDEIVDLWNVVFPEDRNIWFDEAEKAFHIEARTPSQPRLAYSVIGVPGTPYVSSERAGFRSEDAEQVRI